MKIKSEESLGKKFRKMAEIIVIEKLMTPAPQTVGLDQSLAVAKEFMEKLVVRHLPVKSGGELIGVISDRDINFILAQLKESPENLTVKDAYTSDPYIVSRNTPVAEVARHMADNQIGSALVAENDKLIGIFTVTDACRALADMFSGT